MEYTQQQAYDLQAITELQLLLMYCTHKIILIPSTNRLHMLFMLCIFQISSIIQGKKNNWSMTIDTHVHMDTWSFDPDQTLILIKLVVCYYSLLY